MKKIFPLLLCYVFTVSQTYAVSGGPVYNTNINPTGTYSGTIQGTTETDDLDQNGPSIPGDQLPAPNTGNTTPSNALGLFSLSVPGVSLATGTFMLFADGTFFSGSINASVDPDSDKLMGILDGTFNFSLTQIVGTTSTTTSITAIAIGRITATISGSTPQSNSLARLTGTANLEVNFGEYDPTTLEPIVERTIDFTVAGFKQSSASGGSSSGTATSSSPTSSGG